jgi:hypothetical protein
MSRTIGWMTDRQDSETAAVEWMCRIDYFDLIGISMRWVIEGGIM